MATKSLKGHLLIASPRLRDPNFFRTVVFLVQHDEKGSLGLVLNRPLDVSVRAAWKQISSMPCEIDGPLRRGGPCEGVLMALHTDLQASDLEVIEGVHFSTTKHTIEHLVTHGADPVRLFAGYAGWAPGQLESELAEGAWFVVPATSESVFDDEKGSWELLFRSAERSMLSQWLDPKLLPDDPSMN